MTVRIVSNLDVQTQPGCGYCGDPDTPAVAVVHGYPRREFRYTPINPDGVGVADCCVKTAIWRAMDEWDASRPLVWVVPIKAVAA